MRALGLRRCWLSFGFVVLWGSAASAQTVLNPTTVEFVPSSDHSALTSDGQPIVASYLLGLYTIGASQPFQTLNLGKPAPATDGLIRVEFLSLLSSQPPAGVTYEARVSAIGPGGSASSSPSNGFSWEAACSYALGSTGQSMDASGGGGSVGVTAPGGCGWGAESNAGWITVTGGHTGAGNGTVTFTASANTATSPRTGTMAIAGRIYTVTQEGASCSYAISPSTHTAAASGGNGTISITAQAGCGWTASGNASWVSIASGASGSGNGTVSFAVSANTTASPRTATITAAARAFTITQEAAGCGQTLSPGSQSFVSDGGSGSVSVTSPAGCAWTATRLDSWITVTSGASGSGNGTVQFTVAPTTTTFERTGSLSIGNRTFTVTQAGLPCTIVVTPVSQSVSASGGDGSSRVFTADSCSWTTRSNASWITVTSAATQNGGGTATFTSAANPSGSPRTGTLTIAGRTFTVSQAGGSCAYSLSVRSTTAPPTGVHGSVGMSTGAGCAWDATSNASWISVSSSGSGAGTIGYAVSPNTSGRSRTGTVTAGGRTLTITQGPITPPSTPSNFRIVR